MGKFEYMQSAFSSGLKPRARLVLQCLVYHADREGSCFPSLKTIAAECSYGLTTIKRALRELCEAGYVIREARFDKRKNGGQTSNLYTLAEIIPAREAAPVPQAEEAAGQKEIPCAEIVPARDKCASASACMFTYSFSDGMKRRIASGVSAVSPAWPGGQAIFVPP